MSEILGFNDDFETGRRALNTIFSGTANFATTISTTTYATILSGNTIYSGASDLSYIFAPISISSSAYIFSVNPINGAVMPYSGTNIAC